MIVSDFVPQVFLKATGKQATFTTGSTKWLKILALANIQIANWQDEPNVEWNSLRSPDYSIGTVTAAQNFPLPAVVRKIGQQQGDVVRILHSDGVTFTDYDIVDANRFKDFNDYNRSIQSTYVTEVNRMLRFNRAFTAADPQYGGSILVPAYLYAGPGSAPNFLVNDSDVIPVDLPSWLVYATAADYDSTDVTRQNLVPRLEAKANEIMRQMKDNNGGQITKLFMPWRPLAENWVDGAWM